MPHRERLPHRRGCVTFEYDHEGLRYVASVGFMPGTWEPKEVFVNCQRLGTAADSTIRDAAISISLALQYGADLGNLARAMTRNQNGEPSSPIGRLLDLMVHTDENR